MKKKIEHPEGNTLIQFEVGKVYVGEFNDENHEKIYLKVTSRTAKTITVKRGRGIELNTVDKLRVSIDDENPKQTVEWVAPNGRWAWYPVVRVDSPLYKK